MYLKVDLLLKELQFSLSLMLFSQKKTLWYMFEMVLNTPLSYRDSLWYYITGDTSAFQA